LWKPCGEGFFAQKMMGLHALQPLSALNPCFSQQSKLERKKTPLHTVEGWVIKTSYRSSRPVGLSLLPGKPKQKPHQRALPVMRDLGMVDGLGAY